MLQQRLGSKHENGAARRIIECHEHRGHRQLDRFSEADLIREHKARTAESVPLQCQLGEILLVRPESLVLAIDGRFDSGSSSDCRGIGDCLQFLRLDDPAGKDALHVLRDERTARQIYRARIIPQCIKLFLHPHDGFRVVVLPEQLVVHLPG